MPGHALTGPSRARHSNRSGRWLVRPDTFEGALLLRTAQAIGASLLASAIASTLWCGRFLAASIPGLEPMALPALRSDQYEPGRLYEQDAQVAVSAPQRNASNTRIKWMFTVEKARAKMGRAYPQPASIREPGAKES